MKQFVLAEFEYSNRKIPLALEQQACYCTVLTPGKSRV
jgi:hypothetical protein